MKKSNHVRVWVEDVVIPTYPVGEPICHPMFLEKRVYQGSSGRVYPYPVIDKISDQKVDQKHRVVMLENRYLKLMVMPEYGGRIQSACDKTNGYDFIYHNRVIKPALVGLAGPWLSGGIEFNWPQHHRPGTFCPVDYAITKNSDGSQTLWLSEIEPMWHLKGTLGLTLYPDKAFLEINIRLYNRTPLPQSFHFWTNPAVAVNDHYQSVFPPDVQAVYDHGKRDVSAFPVARGQYYKVDYSRGVDISWYKNLPVPTSFMAAKSKYDFIGGYDHRQAAGMLHVADHHWVPGKKQWVWGCGDFGQAWDRHLTDEDGPYAELMCGVFADNQPDFSWLQPYEEKEVKQYFLPYKTIGYVRNATIDAAVSLEIKPGIAKVGIYVTSIQPKARVRFAHQGKKIWEKVLDLAPETPLAAEVRVPARIKPEQCRLEVVDSKGRILVAYTPEPKQDEAIPAPAKAIPEPRQMSGNETLYFAGLHLEQYRHATREPEDYYRQALRRDPGDARNNNALGLLLMRRGQFAKAEPHFRAAIARPTRHHPNPYEGEPHYNLGLCLRYLERVTEAQESFYKATWNAAWQDAAFFQLAQIAGGQGQWDQALDLIDRSLQRNAQNQKASHLRGIALRKLGRKTEALRLIQSALKRDPLDFGARNERLLLRREAGAKRIAQREENALIKLMRYDGHTHLEIAHDYAEAGAYAEAIDLLKRLNQASNPSGLFNWQPMLWYFMGYYAARMGDKNAAKGFFRTAAHAKPDRCFPNSLESILALETALRFNPLDARACSLLGNLWYDKRQVKEATIYWEEARQIDARHPMVHRNLALVFFNKQRQPAKALASMQRAFELDPNDSRILLELDLLKKRCRIAPAKRLACLEHHRALVDDREDLLIEYVTLLNFFARHQEALGLLKQRSFHPWEGGEGKVTGQYVVSLVEMAAQWLHDHQPKEALELLGQARVYPPNLGEGRLHGTQENAVLFWMGEACAGLGQTALASEHWTMATQGMRQPAPILYYNDQNPESIFYQGMALLRLGRPAQARQRFSILRDFGLKHLKDKVVIDYFAVSLPEFLVFDDDLDVRNQINCRMLMALGYWGLGARRAAHNQFRQVLKLDPAHQSAQRHLRLFHRAADFLAAPI